MNSVMYIATDTETGGLGDEVSLLSAYFGALDKDFNLVDELDLLIKPNDGLYHIQAQALNVNKIDLISHDKVALTYDRSATEIYNFLEKVNPKGELKLIPVGHNVAFDIRSICRHTLSKKSWDKYVSYRVLDTGTISQFLILIDRLPKMNASLGTLAKHFNIEFNAHTAKGDALACASLMKEFIRVGSQY